MTLLTKARQALKEKYEKEKDLVLIAPEKELKAYLERSSKFIQPLTYSPSPLPFAFDDIYHKVNYFAHSVLLKLGSGYVIDIYKYTNKKMDSLIQYGLVAWIVNGFSYESDALLTLSEYQIANTFGFPIKREVPHAEIKGVKIDQEIKPLMELAKLMQAQLKAIGKGIFELHKKTLGHFIVDTLASLEEKHGKEAYKTTSNPAQYLVEALATQFECLNDSPYYTKAQSIVKMLHKNCRDENPLFNFHDIGELMATPDPKLAAVLRRDQLIMFKSSVDSRIKKMDAFTVEEKATDQMLTACALVVDQLKSLSSSKISSQDVEYHFRTKLKVEEYASFPRMLVKQTIRF